jgi:hypothetical protein
MKRASSAGNIGGKCPPTLSSHVRIFGGLLLEGGDIHMPLDGEFRIELEKTPHAAARLLLPPALLGGDGEEHEAMLLSLGQARLAQAVEQMRDILGAPEECQSP